MGLMDWFRKTPRPSEPSRNVLAYLPAGTPDPARHGIQPVGTPEEQKAPLAWVDAPNGERWLDCRSVTRGSVSTAKDSATLDRFIALRTDVSDSIRDAHPTQARSFPFSIPLPSPLPPSGRLFTAPRLEYKWDSAFQDGAFLFTRSWTGDLVYRFTPATGMAEVGQPMSQGDAFDAAALTFLLRLYALGEPVPHPLIAVDEAVQEDAKRAMALWSFQFFGCDARFGRPVQGG